MAIRLGCLARPPYSHIPVQTSTVNRYLFPASPGSGTHPMSLLQNKNLLAQIRDEEASVVPPRLAARPRGSPLPTHSARYRAHPPRAIGGRQSAVHP